MFCGGQFEFLMYARSASSRSGTEIYGNRSEPPRSSKKMTRDETEMIAFRILHYFEGYLFCNLPKITMWEEEALS